MAEIIPFRAWRYAPKFRPQISQLSLPALESYDEDNLSSRYRLPQNSIHLALPESPSPTKAATLLDNWKSSGVLIQDPLPSIYVYFQHFNLPGSSNLYCRKGFIAFIRAYHWEDRVVLRHEDTISHALPNRVQQLEKSQIHPTPTLGLYEDPQDALTPLMDQAMKTPLYDFKNDLGIREQLAAITQEKDIMQFVQLLKGQQVILADGHHRFQAAILHRDNCKRKGATHTGMEGYNYHMMNFTNLHSDALKILPTHRVISNVNITKEHLLQKTALYFTVERIPDDTSLESFTITKPWTYMLMLRGDAYEISLRKEKFNQFAATLPDTVKRLDISVLHYFFVECIIGIPMNEQRSSEQITFETDLIKCQEKLSQHQADVAIITREISVNTVMEVCKSGYTLPQKTTNFYPKTSSGLLFGSIKENEFSTFP
ncbi:DUF1015 domain-containing protein [Echinicola vietnamensis]|uniref:DUF1015 domain-containing protein n=1 Tax=Echinicola vietnamensis (strain DSM 17526 / LMG 23754 / KMM 6221) TaxID=926556 RepID=L0G4D7_ECHVK|nr:DUF1015 domain-containing protein [Echinicola vietnamensis]AGA80173.1 hypothetical protein Echvi_3963 [Echinicola vietnamensis DSM 17526]